MFRYLKRKKSLGIYYKSRNIGINRSTYELEYASIKLYSFFQGVYKNAQNAETQLQEDTLTINVPLCQLQISNPAHTVKIKKAYIKKPSNG